VLILIISNLCLYGAISTKLVLNDIKKLI